MTSPKKLSTVIAHCIATGIDLTIRQNRTSHRGISISGRCDPGVRDRKVLHHQCVILPTARGDLESLMIEKIEEVRKAIGDMAVEEWVTQMKEDSDDD